MRGEPDSDYCQLEMPNAKGAAFELRRDPPSSPALLPEREKGARLPLPTWERVGVRGELGNRPWRHKAIRHVAGIQCIGVTE